MYKLQAVIIAVAVLALAVGAYAYTVVTASTGAVAGIEKEFIGSTTNQYLSNLIVNPLVPNTYQIKLIAPNPNYTKPVTETDLLQAVVQVSTFSYVYGWADGMEYGRGVDLSRISNYIIYCSSPSYFGASTTTWNEGVCTSSLMAAELDIYNMKYSSPTVVPGY